MCNWIWHCFGIYYIIMNKRLQLLWGTVRTYVYCHMNSSSLANQPLPSVLLLLRNAEGRDWCARLEFIYQLSPSIILTSTHCKPSHRLACSIGRQCCQHNVSEFHDQDLATYIQVVPIDICIGLSKFYLANTYID